MPLSLSRAKRELIEALRDSAWCRGVGLAKIDGELALVLSVSKGATREAEELLADLALEVPVHIRELVKVSSREGREE